MAKVGIQLRSYAMRYRLQDCLKMSVVHDNGMVDDEIDRNQRLDLACRAA